MRESLAMIHGGVSGYDDVVIGEGRNNVMVFERQDMVL